MMYWTTVPTPAGQLMFVADDDVVLAAGWTDDVERLRTQIAPDLRPTTLTQRTTASRPADAVAAYCDGELSAPAAVEVRQVSGRFVTAAWASLRTVEPGEVITYSQLAERAGNPSAVRAAGTACATNPSALFVPCHRVVRRDHGLGGFAWGLDVKRWLLGHEQVAAHDGVLSG